MIIKLISNSSIVDFNDELEQTINDMEKNNNVLVDSKYVPVQLTKNVQYVQYTVLLYFANPYKEQSKMASMINMMTTPGNSLFMK